MTEEVRQNLEALRERTNADTYAEVIRRALAVYEFLWERKSGGGKVIVKDEDEDGERELVIV